jgi:DNA-binding protein YbaB
MENINRKELEKQIEDMEVSLNRMKEELKKEEFEKEEKINFSKFISVFGGDIYIK